MPKPIDKSQSYYPGLDGVRALAVLAVLAYHIGVPQTPGGLLGVGIFFTLSGYLITSLLYREYDRTGGIKLGSFWIRRIKRLMPALIAVLITVSIATAIATPAKLGEILWKALGGLFYFANWQTIFAGESYFDRFEPAGPLDHLWSLAIEEQFYIVWPLVMFALLPLLKRSKAAATGIVLALSAGSFFLLWYLAEPGFDNTRAYEGSDTRAGALLLGAALALLAPTWRKANYKRGTTALIDVLALTGLATTIWLIVATDQYSMELYSYGILVLSIATCALLHGATTPGTVTQRIFSLRPLTWVGERSYGIYLWHLPVISLFPNAIIEFNPYLAAAAETVISIVLAVLSWKFIEDPIRRWSPTKSRKDAVDPLVASTRVPRRGSVLIGGLATLLLATTVFTAPQMTQAGGVEHGTGRAKVFMAQPAEEQQSIVAATAVAEPSASDAPAATTPDELKTKCSVVVHIGDSTSVGMMSEDFLPDPADRVDAQYKKYGAQTVYTDIHGGRSIFETPADTVSVTDAVEQLKPQLAGQETCWVVAMGTNEVANIAAGSNYTLEQRIDYMMELVGDDPVLWPTVRSIPPAEGFYDNSEMQKMNVALEAATHRYNNLWVYDWGAQNKDEWYQADGIHFTTPGNQWRSKIFARALATAFPADGENLSEHVFIMAPTMIDTE